MRVKFWLSLLLLFCLGKVTQAAPPQVRVLSYNIHHAQGNDGKFDLERLAKIIVDCRADLVALQEVDVKTKRASGVDQAAELAKLTKLHHAFGSSMPFSGGEYGNAVLSRWPITSSTKHQLPSEQPNEPRSALEAKIKPDNGLPELVFLSTHLCHLSERVRTQQAKKLNEIVAADVGPPVLLAGDFNAQYDSDTLRALREKRWLDSAKHAKVIDYILLRPIDGWRVVELQTLDEPVASDHLPILAVLEWTK
ncbi:MAG TPA: endonuclease/exonuclease/phosphatase family protein [Pirellulaceae bacterium]|nr:endonuclease/exonuclease/phosphatase family protein [Pirellulaceae bacterium]